MDDLRYQALTYKLRGAIFEAHNTLRIGWSEEVYHQGMLEVLNAARQYGLGYPDTLYRKILAVETAYRGLECQQNVVVPASWGGRILAHQPSEYLLVGETCLINMRADFRCWPTLKMLHTVGAFLTDRRKHR